MVEQTLSAGGKIVSGIASYEAGKFNRAMSRTEATEQLRAGTAEEARVREAARAAIGQQVAAQGANGFQAGTGSAIDALMESQIAAAADALAIRKTAAARARSARVQGDIAYAAGSNDMVAGMLGAASTAYAGASDWADARSGRTPPQTRRG